VSSVAHLPLDACPAVAKKRQIISVFVHVRHFSKLLNSLRVLFQASLSNLFRETHIIAAMQRKKILGRFHV
jgi:hypothetical protein